MRRTKEIFLFLLFVLSNIKSEELHSWRFSINPGDSTIGSFTEYETFYFNNIF